MEGYDEECSINGFQKDFQMPDLCCLHEGEKGFIFCSRNNEGLLGNGDNNYSTLHLLMKEIISGLGTSSGYVIQYWTHKTNENNSYLSTSDQPFALGCLRRGHCYFRKKCTEYMYNVGGYLEEFEEFGPPGRVFLSGQPESSPDMRLYSVREFPLLIHAINCDARNYLVLHLFDLKQKKCYGVLECIGLPCKLEYIL